MSGKGCKEIKKNHVCHEAGIFPLPIWAPKLVSATASWDNLIGPGFTGTTEKWTRNTWQPNLLYITLCSIRNIIGITIRAGQFSYESVYFMFTMKNGISSLLDIGYTKGRYPARISSMIVFSIGHKYLTTWKCFREPCPFSQSYWCIRP